MRVGDEKTEITWVNWLVGYPGRTEHQIEWEENKTNGRGYSEPLNVTYLPLTEIKVRRPEEIKYIFNTIGEARYRERFKTYVKLNDTTLKAYGTNKHANMQTVSRNVEVKTPLIS